MDHENSGDKLMTAETMGTICVQSMQSDTGSRPQRQKAEIRKFEIQNRQEQSDDQKQKTKVEILYISTLKAKEESHINKNRQVKKNN